MNALRVFWVGGLISYRALFNWLRPEIYIPTMLGSPLFQIIFFAKLGDYAGVENDAFFVVGNALQVSAMAGIYGMTMTIANERYFGTLSSLLATPANRLALFLGRAVPLIANGLLISLFGFAVGSLLLDFVLPAEGLPGLGLVLVVTAFACTSFGLLLGSIGLRARDVFFISNLVYFLMLLLCGVNIRPEALPGWMQAISYGLPLTRGIQAARGMAIDNESFAQVAHLVWGELTVGILYAAGAYLLFRMLEVEARRRASLETY
ncbi:MAG: ABC transporter permease [Actinomycetota bacterium]